MTEAENLFTKAVEKYLDYYQDQASGEAVSYAKRTLTDFAAYLQGTNVSLGNISIDKVDQFLAVYNKGYARAEINPGRRDKA